MISQDYNRGGSNVPIFAFFAILALFVIGAVAYMVHTTGSGRGGTSNADAIVLDTSLTAGTTVTAGTSLQIGSFELLGGATGLRVDAGLPTCNTASSTLFAIAPPSAATSTVTLLPSAFGGNATTSSLLIGTSTKSSGLAATDVSPTLVNSTNGIASSTTQWVASGNTLANGGGFISSGANSAIRILVKPGEFVVGYATTTATGAGAAQYAPGFTNCAPRFQFNK